MKQRYFVLLAAVLCVWLSTSAWALTDREYTQKARRLKAVRITNTALLKRLRMERPNAVVDIRGQISGVLASSTITTLMIRLKDGDSAEVKIHALPKELQSGIHVKCLARGASSGSLEVQAIILDANPTEEEPPQTVQAPPLIVPATPQAPLPSRGGGDELINCKRAIVHFNPKLPMADVEIIANSIVTYSNHLGVDPYFVVAIVAAESRFNPNARSYKGAMGLGQLMPGTASGMGVKNAYDPVENLAAAIKIIRRNLEKYDGQPYQVALALAAYNAGPGAVKKYGGVPPYRETRNYVWKIYEYYCWMHGIQPESRK